jgi:hypothetical protein
VTADHPFFSTFLMVKFYPLVSTLQILVNFSIPAAGMWTVAPQTLILTTQQPRSLFFTALRILDQDLQKVSASVCAMLPDQGPKAALTVVTCTGDRRGWTRWRKLARWNSKRT